MNPLVLSYNRHAALINCLAQQGKPAARSRHFTIYRLDLPVDAAPSPARQSHADRPGAARGSAPFDGAEFVVVHTFTPAQIDNNLGYYVANELLPLLGTDRQADFEHFVGALVRSIDLDERRAWHVFYSNSLAALRRAMAEPEDQQADFIGPFGAIYRRVADLISGRTLLDVGTCFGFMPLLLGEVGNGRGEPSVKTEQLDHIVGCDLEAALMSFARSYADDQRLDHIRFVVADVLADDIGRLGMFDIVTAIHLLEHLESAQTELAIANLWRMTSRRLIVNVPLEETPDPRFGHHQVFGQDRLAAFGRQLGGDYRYFEYHGGWLVVDRF